jgi:CheY-like chemotaxis protein/anti-sigma regulatory factor (Ser/Thr protein kinase)
MRLNDVGRINAGGSEVDAREIIARQIDHLVRLVDDLLDVSRITQGKLALKKSFVELQPIIDMALETNEAFFRERRHRLKLNMPAEKIWLNGDSVRLAQAVSNLLHNAGKYTPEGGQIALSVTTEANRLRIAIEDDGIGIAAENIPQIFELFTQAQRLKTRAPEGLGVGLSLVKRLVELHGGSVSASSRGPGHGSVFAIDLPINPKQPVSGSASAAAGPAAGKRSLRILLVDDSVDAANTLKLLLQAMGHDVTAVNDGQAALALAPQLVPHLVLLDIGLPGRNGYEVAIELRKFPELRRTTLAALTGYGQHKDRQKAFASGFSRHLIKPLNMDDLTRLLDGVEIF